MIRPSPHRPTDPSLHRALGSARPVARSVRTAPRSARTATGGVPTAAVLAVLAWGLLCAGPVLAQVAAPPSPAASAVDAVFPRFDSSMPNVGVSSRNASAFPTFPPCFIELFLEKTSRITIASD